MGPTLRFARFRSAPNRNSAVLTRFRQISGGVKATLEPFERYGQPHPVPAKTRSKRAVGGTGVLNRLARTEAYLSSRRVKQWTHQ